MANTYDPNTGTIYDVSKQIVNIETTSQNQVVEAIFSTAAEGATASAAVEPQVTINGNPVANTTPLNVGFGSFAALQATAPKAQPQVVNGNQVIVDEQKIVNDQLLRTEQKLVNDAYADQAVADEFAAAAKKYAENAAKPATAPSTTTTSKKITSTSTLKESLSALEKQTNLSLRMWPFGELCHIKHKFSYGENGNAYYMVLVLLVHGFSYDVIHATIRPDQNKFVLDEHFIRDFLALKNDPVISKFLPKTPAWKMGCFKDVGAYGVTDAGNAASAASSPIYGSEESAGKYSHNLLDRIHPGISKSIEKTCIAIKTHSWLALPKGAFGSLRRLVAAINGAVEAFNELISDIYQGCLDIIKSAYAFVNAQIVRIQKLILSWIDENIISLDLLCLILDAIQVLMDDINFFTSLFGMEGSFMNYLNTFQNYLNVTSQFVSNPFSAISSFLPSNVKNILDTVNQIGQDPNGYLADKLNNYGYGAVLTALQGNIVGALVNKFGPQYASITPLGNILSKATAIYGRFNGQFAATPATMGPNIYTRTDDVKTDVNGNPLTVKTVAPKNISDVIVNSATTTSDKIGNDITKLKNSVGDIAPALGDVGHDISTTLGNIKTSVTDFFTGKK
jgi:hypothetical protein